MFEELVLLGVRAAREPHDQRISDPKRTIDISQNEIGDESLPLHMTSEIKTAPAPDLSTTAVQTAGTLDTAQNEKNIRCRMSVVEVNFDDLLGLLMSP